MVNKRSIPGHGVKDDSGHYVKVESVGPLPTAPPSAPASGPINSEVSLEDVHQRLLIILDRESRRLTEASAHNPLDKDEGIAFERCIKILREFKKEEREYLEALNASSAKEPEDGK